LLLLFVKMEKNTDENDDDDDDDYCDRFYFCL